jgi:hypothetical protein
VARTKRKQPGGRTRASDLTFPFLLTIITQSKVETVLLFVYLSKPQHMGETKTAKGKGAKEPVYRQERRSGRNEATGLGIEWGRGDWLGPKGERSEKKKKSMDLSHRGDRGVSERGE